MPSIAHYLLIDTSRLVITHHAREAAGGIRTSIHYDGLLRLEPPGIDVEVVACFLDAHSA